MAMGEGQWWTKSWSVTTGCRQVSEGCANCYAKALVKRFGDRLHTGPFEEVERHWERLMLPARWRKRHRVFVSPLGDLWHPDVLYTYQAAVFGGMASVPRQRFLVLTKRPWDAGQMLWRMGGFVNNGLLATAAMAVALDEWSGAKCPWKGIPAFRWPLENVWVGVTAETQRWADERLHMLVRLPARHRFVSVEPMLGPIDLSKWLAPRDGLPGIDWVIAGGETGPGARACESGWVWSLAEQCRYFKVPFWFKQWGARAVTFDWDHQRPERRLPAGLED